MFEAVWNKAFEYFTNSKQSVGRTLGNLIIAFFIIVLVDSVFNISAGIQQSATLEKLKEIKELKENYISDLEMIKYLNDLEDELISKRHPYHKFYSFYSSLSFSMKNENNNAITQNIPQTKPSIVFIALSSSTVLIFFIFAAISSPFWSGNYSTKNIVESLAMATIITLIVALTTFLLSLVPIIYADWMNYIIYFVLQIFILTFGVKLWDFIEKKRESKV